MRSIILLGTSVLGLGIPAYQQLQSVDRVKLPGTPSAEVTPSSEVAPVAQPESSTEKLQAEQGLPTAPQAAWTTFVTWLLKRCKPCQLREQRVVQQPPPPVVVPLPMPAPTVEPPRAQRE